jgi:putative component of toxin-antitoxin plasmid stabilization module
MIEIEVYETPSGERPFEKWFEKVERQAQHRIRVAIARLEEGNSGNRLVILLHGGTKQRQQDDISKARQLWRACLAERY